MSTIRLALFSMRPEWEADRSMRWIEEEEIDNGRGRRSERIDEPFLISFKEEEERERDVWMIHNNKKKMFHKWWCIRKNICFESDSIQFYFFLFSLHFETETMNQSNNDKEMKINFLELILFLFCFICWSISNFFS